MMRTLRALVVLFVVVVFLVPFSANAVEMTWARFEGFGSVAFQDISPGGTMFSGGLRYTPIVGIQDNFSVKPFVGTQLFKGSSGKKYMVLDYGAMAQFHHLGPVIVDVGVGGGTAFRETNLTRAMVVLGLEYKLETPFLGLIDRLLANAHYVFNSSELFIVHYGASISF